MLLAASLDFGDTAMIDLLVQAGARADAKSPAGKTALDLAREYKHAGFVSRLERASGPFVQTEETGEPSSEVVVISELPIPNFCAREKPHRRALRRLRWAKTSKAPRQPWHFWHPCIFRRPTSTSAKRPISAGSATPPQRRVPLHPIQAPRRNSQEDDGCRSAQATRHADQDRERYVVRGAASQSSLVWSNTMHALWFHRWPSKRRRRELNSTGCPRRLSVRELRRMESRTSGSVLA